MNGYITKTCLLHKMHTYESRMAENSDACCVKEEIRLKIHRNEEGIYRALYSVQDQIDYVDSEKYPESDVSRSTHKSLFDIHKVYRAW